MFFPPQSFDCRSTGVDSLFLKEPMKVQQLITVQGSLTSHLLLQLARYCIDARRLKSNRGKTPKNAILNSSRVHPKRRFLCYASTHLFSQSKNVEANLNGLKWLVAERQREEKRKICSNIWANNCSLSLRTHSIAEITTSRCFESKVSPTKWWSMMKSIFGNECEWKKPKYPKTKVWPLFTSQAFVFILASENTAGLHRKLLILNKETESHELIHPQFILFSMTTGHEQDDWVFSNSSDQLNWRLASSYLFYSHGWVSEERIAATSRRDERLSVEGKKKLQKESSLPAVWRVKQSDRRVKWGHKRFVFSCLLR